MHDLFRKDEGDVAERGRGAEWPRALLPGTVVRAMLDETPSEAVATPESSYDDEGVDRTLIRELLELTPIERVRRVESMAQSVLLLWELNGIPRAR